MLHNCMCYIFKKNLFYFQFCALGVHTRAGLEALAPPGAGAVVGCELPNIGMLESNSGSLQEE